MGGSSGIEVDAPASPGSHDHGVELTIVVPVYNEGEAVEPVLRALEAAVTTSHETLVVFDFPADTTVPVVERLTPELPFVRGLLNERGRGVLQAMRAGFDAAAGELILTSMADGSDEPHVIDEMVVQARAGADVVAGSRYMSGGHQLGGPPVKRLLSRLAGLTLHWFGGVPIHDATSNFRLYRASFLRSVTIQSTAGFELALELTVKATLGGYRLAEVPTTWRDRTSGTSNFKLRAWLPHYLHWYALAFRARLRRSPPARGDGARGPKPTD